MALNEDVPQLHRRPGSAPRGRQVERALTIMEVLAESDGRLGLSEVARRAELPKTTASRILADLVSGGVADRVGEYYQPGLRLLALARHTEPAGAAIRRRLVQPHLERLREEIGLAVAFATLRYDRVRFELSLYVSAKVDVLTPVPNWAPVHCTCTGKVLLAFAPRAELHLLRDRALPGYTAQTVTSPAALGSELARIREQGVAHNDGEYLSGVSGLAVPVLGPRHGVFGVMAVCGAPHEVARRSVLDALRRAAAASSTPAR